MKFALNKYGWATLIAVFFHSIGLIGILFFDRSFFVKATVYNLLLSLLLLLWTGPYKQTGFWLFFAAAAIIGFGAEAIGINTGKLFGLYRYTHNLGPMWLGVPLIIAVKWFIVTYGVASMIHALFNKLTSRMPTEAPKTSPWLKFTSVVIDGATLAIFFDWIMEPVAVKLGYWQWLENGSIPAFNYISWFVISMTILICFELLQFNRRNKFAVNLLLIQIMFFLLLRTFLE